jgi:hypothetical protein
MAGESRRIGLPYPRLTLAGSVTAVQKSLSFGTAIDEMLDAVSGLNPLLSLWLHNDQ